MLLSYKELTDIRYKETKKQRYTGNQKHLAEGGSHAAPSLRLSACDPTIRQPGFDLPGQQWSLLNRFRTEQGHCGACRRKWRLADTDLCPCGETQTVSHIVESCPLAKLNGGLSRLHSADEDAVSWLTSLWLMTRIREVEEEEAHGSANESPSIIIIVIIVICHCCMAAYRRVQA